jgi:hypothetical protein
MNNNPSPRELADEALRALKDAPMTPGEHFEFLIEQGIIDRSGRVLVAKLFKTDLPQAKDGVPASSNLP